MKNMFSELNPEELEKVSGGLVVDDGKGQYWIVRQDGSVIAPTTDKENAVSFAKAFNTAQDIITLEEYKKKFGRDLSW